MYRGHFSGKVNDGSVAMARHYTPILDQKLVIVPACDDGHKFLSLCPQPIPGKDNTGDLYPVHLTGRGRVAIPKQMREYASIGREVVVVGEGDHLELWDSREWKKWSASHKRYEEPTEQTAQAYPAAPALPEICAKPPIAAYFVPLAAPETVPANISAAPSASPNNTPEVPDWLDPFKRIVVSSPEWEIKLVSPHGRRVVYLLKGSDYTDMGAVIMHTEIGDGQYRVVGIIHGPPDVVIDKWDATYDNLAASLRAVRRCWFGWAPNYLEEGCADDPSTRAIQRAHAIRSGRKNLRGDVGV